MEKKTSENRTLMAVLAYVGILVLVPLLTDAKKDPFVKYHVKQGLVLLITGIIVGAISWIPLIGWAAGIIVFILFIMGILNALNGKEQPLPIIGQFADKFKI